jgi:hypothetical protein
MLAEQPMDEMANATLNLAMMALLSFVIEKESADLLDKFVHSIKLPLVLSFIRIPLLADVFTHGA